MLQVQEIDKSYDGKPLLRGLSFHVAPRETVCLLGPSGSGKSTTLQLIAGLSLPDSGRLLWDGEDLGSTPTYLRNFGLVFQDYALFPHLDVLGNVAFGLRMKGVGRAEASKRVQEVLQLVNLDGFDHRSVTSLSGGEQQRVALSRALAPQPRLLMLDEPLAALDRSLRQELLDELRGILARTHVPALYVTHDQEEAFKIADRILLLHEGYIVQAGSPADVWSRPVSSWVAVFLGLGNILSGEIIDKKPRIRTSYGTFLLHCSHKHKVGDVVHVLARPIQVRTGATVGGVVRDVVFRHDGYRVTLSNGLFFDADRAPRLGNKVTVTLKLECLGVFQID